MLAYLVVGLLSGGLGVAELVSRYRDRPSALLGTVGTWFYVGVNAAAAVAALFLIRVFGWDFGSKGETVGVVRILVAAFGSLALFRSALFTVRAGERDIAIGPSTLLTLALEAADRGVDRSQGKRRTATIARLLRGVSFEKAKTALPTFCINLMEGVPAEQQKRLVDEVAALERDRDMADQMKTYNLGIAILRVTGDLVLEAAITALGDELKA